MGLTFTNRVVAEASIEGLYGRKTIGGYQLSFNIKLGVNGWRQPEEAVIMQDWSAKVYCGQKGQEKWLLGKAQPAVPVSVRTYDYTHDAPLEFCIDLTPQQLAGLEELRAGGELAFQLVISTLCEGINLLLLPESSSPKSLQELQLPCERLPLYETLNFHSNITEWKRVLDEFGFAKLMVFSLALPHGPVAEKLASAKRMLDQAQEDFVHGRYEQVVAISRRLMESIEAALEQRAATVAAVAKFKNGGKERESMNKVERFFVVREAVRNYTQLAHHVDKKDGSPEFYSRSDATFMLAMAGAIFSEAVACEANLSN